MNKTILSCFVLASSLASATASPVVQEVTVYPFAATITHQADLVIEEYVPLDAERPGKKWTFKNPNVSKRTVWRVTAESNTVFNAWLDTDGNGKYDIGEPFGTSAGRDYPEIELTNFSPITPRIDLVSQKSDRGLTPSNILQSIRDYIDITYGGGNPQVYSNMLRQIEWIKGNLFEQTGLIGDSLINQRIRIVRWLINGVPNYRGEFDPKIVLDKTINTRIRNYLTEADVLATDGVFDIDWNDLYDSISPRMVEAACGEPTNITYMIVIGDGPFTWTTSPQTNFVIKACNTVITRKFSFCDEKSSYGPEGTWWGYYILRRTEPLPAIVNGNRVTLAWHVDIPLIDDYTAFRIKILSSGAEVHDTGLFRSPARHSDGTQRWMIKTELAPGTYDWKIAAYNSKFFHEDTSLYTNGVPFTVTGE